MLASLFEEINAETNVTMEKDNSMTKRMQSVPAVRKKTQVVHVQAISGKSWKFVFL